MTDASASGMRVGETAYISGTASSSSLGSAVTRRRFCTVTVTMVNGRVNRVNYVGPTGGLPIAGEQCAYVVQGCAQ
jgi:hypothetical protein